MAGGGVLDRFSNRVDNYIKFRPDYPAEVLVFLKKQGLLNSETVIADIGSGTGISSELFLKTGNVVYGVEPNKEMRTAAERLLSGYKNFKSIDATAENTTCESNSIDLIVAGQAFHWFDKKKSKTEFKRILRGSNGSVVLMWNDRRTDTTQFLQAYEDLIKMFATDYLEVNHKNIDEKIFSSFFDGHYKMESFLNYQYFDLDGLKGRILSSSYMPDENHKDFDFMMSVLKKIFTRFAEEGKVRLEYDTKIYYDKIAK
ncbi:MAG: class I SAM-dependent methyltransferase [Bacteroidetes bacterium]|nr:class I SAM-dependent methyltransferase [Bacteroidota bacterium]